MRLVLLIWAGGCARVTPPSDGVGPGTDTGAVAEDTAGGDQAEPPDTSSVDTGLGVDDDGDGYGDVVDCDDDDPTAFPGADEVCEDGVDNNCDGVDPHCTLAGEVLWTDADVTWVGETSGDGAGQSVAFAGDVDGDGVGDVVVGAYYESTAGMEAGAVYLVVNPGEGTEGLKGAHAKILGEEEGDRAGRWVSSAGDWDGDGYADLFIGAAEQSHLGPSRGAAYVVLGPLSGTSSLTEAELRIYGESNNDHFGRSVSGNADVDGDGRPDLVVGANREDEGGDSAGAAYVFAGSFPNAVNAEAATAKLVGEESDDWAGSTVALVRDVDGDGLSDVMVGAYTHSETGREAGAAYVLLDVVEGTQDLVDADTKLTGVDGGDWAGRGLAGGDLNNDGYGDLVVGASRTGGGGVVLGATYVLYGPVTGTHSLSEAEAVVRGESEQSEAGDLVVTGDLNADGFDDVIVGAPNQRADPSVEDGPLPGASYVQYGPLSGASSLSDADVRLVGRDDGDEAGWALAGGGDVNGDGFDDLLVGAWLAGGGSDDVGAGEVVLLYGGGG